MCSNSNDDSNEDEKNFEDANKTVLSFLCPLIQGGMAFGIFPVLSWNSRGFFFFKKKKKTRAYPYIYLNPNKLTLTLTQKLTLTLTLKENNIIFVSLRC